VGAAAVAAVEHARARGGRVVAAGTSVVRALEGAAQAGGGSLRTGGGVTGLRLGPGTQRRVVDGLLTGVHEPGTSHFELLRAFAPDGTLAAAVQHAEHGAYLGHEFGDFALLLAA
jgi:S-adenosylmethionine:tRNA ribosyltransferase-isomerase